MSCINNWKILAEELVGFQLVRLNGVDVFEKQ